MKKQRITIPGQHSFAFGNDAGTLVGWGFSDCLAGKPDPDHCENDFYLYGWELANRSAMLAAAESMGFDSPKGAN